VIEEGASVRFLSQKKKACACRPFCLESGAPKRMKLGNGITLFRYPEWPVSDYCVERFDVNAIFCIGGFFSCILERLMADV
jgi:hypothetical protein